MAFVVKTFEGRAGDRSGKVYELIDDEETVRAEVWPMWGFNCLRWQFRRRDGSWTDLLHVAPDWEANPVPTRSGHPVLFPFPGRLKEGSLSFQGRKFQRFDKAARDSWLHAAEHLESDRLERRRRMGLCNGAVPLERTSSRSARELAERFFPESDVPALPG
jgi:hypothetical protein